ncbi:hypothetical protein [Agromyces sp. NPDC058064]|uniref:hypothetical protein n=1 Tax=Agromyces sp. NPDC058064 TaxID=3346322 RepID=UPI0036DE94B0
MSFDGNGYVPEQVQTGARRLPDQWTIRLLYPRPPFGLSANDRPHHMVKSRAIKAMREEVMFKVRQARVPALERCRVDLVWYVADHRTRDEDNLAPMAKAIYDGIGSNKGISARIVDDDSPEFMEKTAPVIEYMAGGEPHFAVIITDLGSAL